ncbi:MAG: GNAT family N-acetyltransferase [Treponema sp.]
MSENIIHEKAERIRDVIRYIKRFKNAKIIIYIDDEIIDSPLFLDHIKDICLIHESGIQVLIVPGARKRINEILTASKINWNFKDGNRITSSNAMPLIKMAAFDVSNQVMTALAGEKVTAVIGNWVSARGKGIINGFDYGTSGEIDKLQDDSIRTVLNNGFIPIFPCIGWSNVGKPYNISSTALAEQIAVHLQADKLFFLLPSANISKTSFIIPNEIGTSPEGNIPAMNLEELSLFLKTNEQSVNSNDSTNNHSVNSLKSTNEQSVNIRNSTNNQLVVEKREAFKERIFSLLHLSEQACKAGVSRVHILNGSVDGTLPCEIFSDLGSGTMIYKNNYGGIRQMTHEDISSVLSLMKPFVDKGILLPRTESQLNEQFQDYIVYEIDGIIRACSALHQYNDGQMEIAAVAVDESCAHIGIGPKLISFLVDKARHLNAKSVFILTTQTSDWFEQLGFVSSDISTLPQKRKDIWTPDRGSKLMRLILK